VVRAESGAEDGILGLTFDISARRSMTDAIENLSKSPVEGAEAMTELEQEMIMALMAQGQLIVPRPNGDQVSLGPVNLTALAQALADRVKVNQS
jgi:hypothetical protein